MFMPRVELLADSDFEPAAVPRVDGLNLLGAAGKQKLEKGVAFSQTIFPKFCCVCSCRFSPRTANRSCDTFPSAPSELGPKKLFC